MNRPRKTPALPTLADIEQAAQLLDGVVERTPAIRSDALSLKTGAEVILKLENFQRTGSFKTRGSYIKLQSLSARQKKRGVIAMSRGNHAQGVAYHAGKLKIPATIVMPKGTPNTKVMHTRDLGAEVVIAGNNLAEAAAAAVEMAEKKKRTLVHPYDDPAIIAGQGTIALELLEDYPDIDLLLVPVGGGGLISGIAIAAKSINPDIEIVGVETELYPSMQRALGNKVFKGGAITLAEGIAVSQPGKLTKQAVKKHVDEIIVVKETSIEQAIEIMADTQYLVVEGAGAVGLAAMLEFPSRFRKRKVGMIVSGGNIDSRILASVLMRGLAREGRLVRIRIQISDEPGALGNIAQIIGKANANIVEVQHQRLFYDVSVKLAEVDMVLETQDSAHADRVIEALVDGGYPTRRLASTYQQANG